MKYRRHDLHGLIVIDKPLGLSSMDVVRRVRRDAGFCRTGHAGTLDPLATGVLVCCLGKATRSVQTIMDMTKVYQATVRLDAFTNTDDAEGEPETVRVDQPPDQSAIRQALDQLTGSIEQKPPAYSAVKVNGQRAYRLAREGQTVDLPARTVRVDEIRLERYRWPELELTITCGKGTYIRSLARQIGQALGTGGYLTALRRTAVGPYTTEHAHGLDELPSPFDSEHLLPAPDPVAS